MNDRKIRLMQITHDLQIGGLQRIVVDICRNIDRSKFDVSVLCLRETGKFECELKEMGIEVLCLPQPHNGTDYLSFIKVAKILRPKRPDIIHTHNTQPFLDGTAAAFIAGIKGIIHTDHARDFPDKRRYMFAELVMSHFVDKIVAVSEHTRKNLIEYERIRPEKISVILNGIDGTKYSMPIDVKTKREELGIPGDKTFIIGLGVRLSRQKGIEYLIHAIKLLVAEFPELLLLIAGEGERDSNLRREAENLGVSKHVLFLGPRLDMNEISHALDLYVLPSLWEGLPLVLLEAMAASLPIIATNVGGNPEAVEDGCNGLLVRPKDPAALAEAIRHLIVDRDKRIRFGHNSFELYLRRFALTNMIERYEELYKQVFHKNH